MTQTITLGHFVPKCRVWGGSPTSVFAARRDAKIASVATLALLAVSAFLGIPAKNGGSAVSYAPSVPRFSMIALIIPSTSRSSFSLRELSRIPIRFFAASSAPISG